MRLGPGPRQRKGAFPTEGPSCCLEAKPGFRARLRRPHSPRRVPRLARCAGKRSAFPQLRAANAVRIRVPVNEKGPSGKEGPLGDLEAKPGFEPGVKALQASALPLGHFAVDMKRADSKTGPMHAMERTTGLEPATPTLARLCSTN